MKFSINQKSFNNMLSIVNKAVSPRAMSPALAGVFIEANENEVTLRTTNLQLSTQVGSPALIEEEGSALIPAKLLGDIINTLPDEAVCITSTEDNINISCSKSSFDIRVLDKRDFPDFPEVETTQSVELPFNDFSAMIKKVARMVSKDETRAILQGVNIVYDGQKLEMVATDAYRIAIASKEMVIAGVDSFNAVIPGNFLLDVAALHVDIQNAKVALSQNQVVLTCGDIVFINRRIEGNFPNYNQLITNDYAIRVTLNTNEMLKAVKRIAVLSMDNPVVKFTFDPTVGIVKLNSDEKDVGKAEESLEAKIAEGPTFSDSEVSSGEPFVIRFNGNYVTEGLSSIDTDDFTLDLSGDIKPGIFRDASGKSLTYILLPIRPN